MFATGSSTSSKYKDVERHALLQGTSQGKKNPEELISGKA